MNPNDKLTPAELREIEVSERTMEQHHGLIQNEALKVFRNARSPDDWQGAGLFDPRAERYIAERLRELSYEPRVPSGGDREHDTAIRLHRVVCSLRRKPDRLPSAFQERLLALANAYRDTKGCYYILKPLGPRTQTHPNANGPENWLLHRERAAERGDDELVWACNVALRGTLEVISDFIMLPRYLLFRADGQQCRVVDLKNVRGESVKEVSLSPRALTTTNDFRECLNSQKGGSFHWLTGNVELQNVFVDLGARLTGRIATETRYWGWHPLPKDPLDHQGGTLKDGFWVSGDGIICQGRVLSPDAKGIYWVPGDAGWRIGLEDRLSAKTSEEKGEPWHQDVPRLGLLRRRQGAQSAEDVEMQYLQVGKEQGTWTSQWLPPSEDADGEHRRLLSAFAAAYMQRVEESVGGKDAWLAMGCIASFAAAPEVYGVWNQWTGLWLHGEARQGKNTVMRWLCKMFGLPGGARDGLRCDSTEASIETMLSQYGSLPCWVDEYMPRLGSWVEALLRGNFNRTIRGKMTLGTGRRDWLGGLVVTAQHTSSDAAIASRYVQIQISESRRKKGPDGEPVNHVDWMREHIGLFHFIGRQLLLERERFVGLAGARLDHWMKLDEVRHREHRSAFVYGVAWAGYRAMREVLGLPLSGGELEAGTRHVMDMLGSAESDVRTRVDVDRVLDDLVGAIELGQTGPFGADPELLRNFFGARELGTFAHPPGASDQARFGPWKSCALWLNPRPVRQKLQAHLRAQGRDLSLQHEDLKAQLQEREFWLPTKSLRFAGGMAHAWGFKLDALPKLGYQPMNTIELLDNVLHWAADQAGRQENEVVVSVNEQDPADVDLFALSKMPKRQLRFKLKAKEGGERLVTLDDWRIEDWPDPRQGPLYSLAAKLMEKR
jgi:hypothetical protein